MGAMVSQITSLTMVYSTVYSHTDQRKHQSSASLAFAVNSPYKWPVTRKMFPFDDVIMSNLNITMLCAMTGFFLTCITLSQNMHQAISNRRADSNKTVLPHDTRIACYSQWLIEAETKRSPFRRKIFLYEYYWISWWRHQMETFPSVTGPLWRESTGHRWIP